MFRQSFLLASKNLFIVTILL